MSDSKAKRDSEKESLLHQEIDLIIEKMAITGEGVARHQGAVVFVPWAAPGDHLKVKIDFAKKNHFRGKILEILKPGPSRIKPPCPIAGKCGGCTWQQISHAEQLLQKQSLLSEVLTKFLKDPELKVAPIISSPKDFAYRNRTQPRLRSNQLGFYGWKTHDWVAAKDCLIIEEPLRAYFKNIPVIKKPLEDQKIELFMTTSGKSDFRVIEADQEDAVFSQVNRFQNENLIESVIQWSSKYKPKKIYDLYAGSGNFSFPLSKAHKSAQIIGVEMSRELVREAQKTQQELKISPQFMEFYAMNVDHFLNRVQPTETDLVVLDPPRGGTSEATLNAFAASGLRHLIYISCSPVSLGRDLAFLRAALLQRDKKLSILQIQPFEMFPQTHHLETLVELSIDSL